MRHPGQHVGALLDMAFEAIAHRDKRHRRTAHLSSTFGLELRAVAAHAKIVGRHRQTANGAHLVAHKDNGNAEQQQRGPHHPQNKHIGGGGKQPFFRYRDV